MKRWILVTEEFGYPMYIMEGCTITDKLSDALIFDERDNPRIKESFFTAMAGYPFKAQPIGATQ